ncbi:MAG TPA: DUF4012 domain-containing protein, partial [Actinomycetota bacterium]|nr:DUF4012 domain-containing protein [Actinomycetota bacterium]
MLTLAAITGGVALVVTAALMPLAIRVGQRMNLVVQPRLFGRGAARITYLGGVVLGLVVISAGLIAGGYSRKLWAILAGMSLFLLIGYIDDRFSPTGIPIKVKFPLQLAVSAGVWFGGLALPGDGPVEAIFAIFLLTGGVNAFNLLDNMDGIAGSSFLGSGIGLAALMIFAGDSFLTPLAAALAGAALGFLFFNFRRGRAYLGDSGSLSAGFLVSALALEAGSQFGPGWRMVAPVAILSVPATDAWVALLSRALHRIPVFQGGTDHISHRLVFIGLTSQAAAVIHGLASVAAAAGVLFAVGTRPELLLAVVGSFALGGMLLLTLKQHDHGPLPFKRRLIWIIGMTLLAAMLLSVAPALSAASRLNRARRLMVEGGAALRSADTAVARVKFDQAGNWAGKAKEDLGSPVTAPARLIPFVGSNLDAVEALADGAELMSRAAVEATRALDAFPATENGVAAGLSQGAIDLESWAQAEPQLRRAASLAADSVSAASSTRGLLVPAIGRARDEFISQGTSLRDGLSGAYATSRILPVFFGKDSPRSWFLVIQNPVELRATGGFLGAFGILRAEGGRLVLESLESNIELPVPAGGVGAPPEYVERYDRFQPRTTWSNVNMTADFPTAAGLMLDLWREGTGESLNGVIAVDAVGLNNLLKVVGPSQHPLAGTVNSDNFLPLALNQVYIDYPNKEDRVDFLLDIARDVWTRLLEGDFRDTTAMVPAIGQSVSGRHLQMFVPEVQEDVEAAGLSGALDPVVGEDFVLVVGQNAAGNKIDYYARREISYGVEVDDEGRISGQLEVVVSNHAPNGLPSNVAGPYLPEDPAGLNRSYLSVYSPRTTRVKTAEVDGFVSGVESHVEKGFNVVSRFLEVLPGKTGSLELDLEGGRMAQGEYRLQVRRQPNLYADDFVLRVRLPNRTVVTAATEGLEVEGNYVTWTGKLSSDKEFFIRYDSSV